MTARPTTTPAVETGPVPDRRWIGYAVDGLLAGAGGLLVAEVIAWLLWLTGPAGSGATLRSPYVAVGSAFIDLTPKWL
jgi:hypothetical protein